MTETAQVDPSEADPLFVAVRDLVVAATAALVAVPDPIVLHDGLEDWVADPSDATVFRRHVPSHPMLRMPARALVEDLPEWSAAMSALRGDATLGPIVDRLVGTPLGAGLLQSEGLLHSAIERSAESADLESLADLVADWRSRLAGDPVPLTTLVVLGGIAPAGAVNLSDDTTVRSMNDVEVVAALRVGAMPIMPTPGPIAFVHHRACIAVQENLRQVVGDVDRDPAEAMALYAARAARVEAALATLRLLGFQNVREYSRITIDQRGSTYYGLRGVGLPGSPDVIDPSIEPRARSLHTDIQAALRDDPQTAIAIRRFSGSHEPRHDEDRLLDLWIAVEALFSPEDATEVTFRVALNVANTIDVAGLTPRGLFNWVRRGYGLRSDLVHGRTPSFRNMPRIHGGLTETVVEAADDLSEVVRIALLRFLQGTVPPDFTDAALRATPTK